MGDRKSYEDSCRVLQAKGVLAPEEFPPLPEKPPRYDDEKLGISFFRTRLADVKLEDLSLPRTFFGRSEISGVSFRGSDLSESTACWNDFIEVDFSLADLSRADLRASIFHKVNFCGANLQCADLRQTAFKNCKFEDANMTGTKLCHGWKWLFRLSREQRKAIDWQSDPGPEPDGG